MKNNLCLEALHYGGKRAIFTKRQQAIKSVNRPELRDPEFIKGRLRRAIEAPTFSYQDIDKPKTRQVMYLREFKIDNRVKYTKVIAEEKKHHFFIITAYRPDYVKERGKTKVLFGEDNENN